MAVDTLLWRFHCCCLNVSPHGKWINLLSFSCGMQLCSVCKIIVFVATNAPCVHISEWQSKQYLWDLTVILESGQVDIFKIFQTPRLNVGISIKLAFNKFNLSCYIVCSSAFLRLCIFVILYPCCIFAWGLNTTTPSMHSKNGGHYHDQSVLIACSRNRQAKDVPTISPTNNVEKNSWKCVAVFANYINAHSCPFAFLIAYKNSMHIKNINVEVIWPFIVIKSWLLLKRLYIHLIV